MKRALSAIITSAILIAPAVYAVELKTEEQKVSYSLGLMIGEQLKSIPNLDFSAFNAAVLAVYKDKKVEMTPAEVREVMTAFDKKQREEQLKKFNALSEENLKKGQQFLADNGKKSGVETTESGLQYKELKAGDGTSPKATDTVKVHYRGTLIDGTEFDSSYARNEPVSFPLNGVIPGWTEGLQLMKEGGKAQLVIPAKLAYGPGGMSEAIGPNETLIFEIELLKVNPATK